MPSIDPRKSATIPVRVRVTDRATLETASMLTGEKLSAFIRRAALEAAQAARSASPPIDLAALQVPPDGAA